MRLSMLRMLGVTSLLLIAAAAPAGASDIYIQWAGPVGSGVIRDCCYATNTVGGSFIEADLGTGIFKGSAFADGAAQSTIATVAYSGIENLVFTNTNQAAVSLGGAYPFEIMLDATFAHTVNPAVNGTWATQLIATMTANVQGDPLREAQVGYSSAENWSGGALSSSAFSITPTQLGGGLVNVTTGTVGALSVLLSMGTIILNTNQTMRLDLGLQPIAYSTGVGYSATTDMSSTATIRMVLPAGVTLSNDAGVPLGWVTTVPEPATGLLVAGGLVCLAGTRRRAPRPS